MTLTLYTPRRAVHTFSPRQGVLSDLKIDLVAHQLRLHVLNFCAAVFASTDFYFTLTATALPRIGAEPFHQPLKSLQDVSTLYT